MMLREISFSRKRGDGCVTKVWRRSIPHACGASAPIPADHPGPRRRSVAREVLRAPWMETQVRRGLGDGGGATRARGSVPVAEVNDRSAPESGLMAQKDRATRTPRRLRSAREAATLPPWRPPRHRTHRRPRSGQPPRRRQAHQHQTSRRKQVGHLHQAQIGRTFDPLRPSAGPAGSGRTLRVAVVPARAGRSAALPGDVRPAGIRRQ